MHAVFADGLCILVPVLHSSFIDCKVFEIYMVRISTCMYNRIMVEINNAQTEYIQRTTECSV